MTQSSEIEDDYLQLEKNTEESALQIQELAKHNRKITCLSVINNLTNFNILTGFFTTGICLY